MDFRRQLLPLLITTLCLLTADALELNQNQTNRPGNNTNSSHNDTLSTVKKFECPTRIGYYASADGAHNMTKFWLCVNWEPHEFNCPKGTHFNVHENHCTEWINENSTREDASAVIEHLEHEGEETNQQVHQHHHNHRKSHRHGHHQQHKSGRHLRKPHPAVVKALHRQHQQLERINRRVDSIDSRLDSLYAYVDSKLRQSAQHSTAV